MTQTGVFLPENRKYPGVFIKGDDALYRYAPALRIALTLDFGRAGITGTHEILRELERLLCSCEVVE